MFKAKVSFSVDNKNYPKGYEVPESVAAQYPNLVTKAEKEEIVPKAEKVEVGEKMNVTEKVRKKK
jgi:hypothetical protein